MALLHCVVQCSMVFICLQSELDQLYARAIFSSGTPFRSIESDDWSIFYQKLRPSWKPLNRKQLASTFLDKEFERVEELVHSKVSASQSLGLMCDGWTNIRRESVINYVITTPSPVFFKTTPTGAESHTRQFIADEMSKVIEEVGEEKFLGVVTDNAANMKSAWRLLKKKYPRLNVYGCVAHGLNLLMHDISNLGYFKLVIENGKKIVKEILYSHKLGSVFREKQGGREISLKLPVKTRWGSHVSFLNSLLGNKTTLKKLCIDERVLNVISKETKKLILDDEIWTAIQFSLMLLEPIAQWITVIEGDKPRMSLVCKIFGDLKIHFAQISCHAPEDFSESNDIMNILQNRRDFCVTNIQRAANALDPSLLGGSLTPEDLILAVECIATIASLMDDVDEGEVLADYANFKVKEGLWGNQYIWLSVGKVSATTWWNGFCSSSPLSKVATRILNLPASSASCERTFSTFGNIHTAKRNRLSNERAGKLVYVSHNVKLLRQKAHSLASKKARKFPLIGDEYVGSKRIEICIEADKCLKNSELTSNDFLTDEEYGSDLETNVQGSEGHADVNNSDDNVLGLGDRPISPNMVTLKRGDYVIIRLSTKKTVKHFIGLIEEHNLDDYLVKYMKKKSDTPLAFIFPPKEETSLVPFEEIRGKLCQPVVGRRDIYSFREDLGSFENLC